MIDDVAVYSESTVAAVFSDIRHALLPNGLRMEYALHGDADAPEKVLLIMGLMCDKEAWAPLLATLLDPSASHGSYQYATFDNRGVGGTDKPLERYTTSQMAQDALMLLDHLQWPKAHIVGISMGGMIAQELVHAAPTRVRSLALLVTTPGRWSGALPGMAQFTTYLSYPKLLLARTKEDVVDNIMGALYPSQYLDATQPDGRCPRDILRAYHLARAEKVEVSAAGAHGQHAAVFSHSVRAARLAEVQSAGFPILIVGATHDGLLHPKNADLLESYLHGDRTRKVVFEDAGHGIQNQKRQELAQELSQLFHECAPAMPTDTELFRAEATAATFSDIRHATLANGLRVEYAVHGSGPEKVLLIMGLMAEKEAWLPTVATLLDPAAASATKYQFVTFDNRGVGGTDHPSEFYTTSQLAQDALQLLDHLQWPQAHVVGMSMGGMISQELAHTAPHRVKSLALIVTSPGFLQGATPRPAQLSGYWQLAKNFVAPSRHQIATKMVYVLYTDAYLERVVDGVALGTHVYNYHWDRLTHARQSATGMYGQYSAVLRHHMNATRLDEIRKAGFPILVIGARQDRLLHPNNSDILYECLKSSKTRRIMFEDAAHGVHVEKRVEVAAALDAHFCPASAL
ncbi:serine protease family S33 [Achlya hypogyna]|uniref:Serine protease family S33 n=1 Tax=Achlya hypogyna TaxID=1202772 RepID=A0A1V9YPN1_ACHHY|nr:serine protease family S33 [Achlya hypogyna]